MGSSNPDRASEKSIYTHVARLFIPFFIPHYPHALHLSACEQSLVRTTISAMFTYPREMRWPQLLHRSCPIDPVG